MSSDALSKSLSLTAARGCVRISMDEGAKARAHFVSRKGSSSFVANVVSDEERKAAIEAINSNRKTRKSLTAEEVTAIDPMTGTEGKWVRPNITFDPAPVHVPPVFDERHHRCARNLHTHTRALFTHSRCRLL